MGCTAKNSRMTHYIEILVLEGLVSGEDLALSKDFWRELKADAARIVDPSEEAQERKISNRNEPGH